MANVVTENIVSLVKDQIGDQMLDQIKSAMGNEGPKTSTALESFVPAILSGVSDLAGSSNGAEKIYSTVGKQDDAALETVKAMMREGQASTVVDQGSGLLGSLFGSNGADKLGNVLSSFSGVSRGNSTSLMGMLAPVIIGVIKRQFMGDASNASDLASQLQNQKGQISAAMPSGLSDQLQSSGFLDSVSSVSGVLGTATGTSAGTSTGNSAGISTGNSTVTSTRKSANETVSSANNDMRETVRTTEHVKSSAGEKSFDWKKYLIPAAVLAVLALLAINFLGGSSDDASESATDAAATTTDAVEGAATDATDAAATATDAAAGAATDAAATATDAAAEAAGSVDVEGVGTELTDMFGGATDTLSGITDVASAEAAVPALQGVGENLGALSGQIEQIPEAARGPLNSIISNGVSALQPLVESASAIPGVGPVIEPVVGPIMETLQGFAE